MKNHGKANKQEPQNAIKLIELGLVIQVGNCDYGNHT
jgi:hypothetical protein